MDLDGEEVTREVRAWANVDWAWLVAPDDDDFAVWQEREREWARGGEETLRAQTELRTNPNEPGLIAHECDYRHLGTTAQECSVPTSSGAKAPEVYSDIAPPSPRTSSPLSPGLLCGGAAAPPQPPPLPLSGSANALGSSRYSRECCGECVLS